MGLLGWAIETPNTNIPEALRAAGEQGDCNSMLRTKLLFLSLLAVFAASAIASSGASAASKGPFWHVAGAKMAIGASEQFKVTGHLVLDGTLLKEPIEIECQVSGTGTISNNQAQGKAAATIEFIQCKLLKPVISGCVVKVENANVRAELAYKGKEGEAGQKMVLLFAPKETNIFTKISLEKCGVLTSAGNKVETNENQGWGTAAEGEPEGAEALIGKLKWVKPNITTAHHQGTNVNVGLKFAGAAAELQSKEIAVSLTKKSMFGAFEE